MVLPASVFNSRHKLQDALRRKIGGGTVSIGGGVSNCTVSTYYWHLKNDCQNSTAIQPVFKKAENMGIQGKGYWCLSRDVSIFLHCILKNYFRGINTKYMKSRVKSQKNRQIKAIILYFEVKSAPTQIHSIPFEQFINYTLKL